MITRMTRNMWLVLVAALLTAVVRAQLADTQFLGAVDLHRSFGNESSFDEFGELVRRADCDPGETSCPGR
jgi:hypothetical protein